MGELIREIISCMVLVVIMGVMVWELFLNAQYEKFRKSFGRMPTDIEFEQFKYRKYFVHYGTHIFRR